jgi:hypothetical protein
VTSTPKFVFDARGELDGDRYKAMSELPHWFDSGRSWNVGF